jgi:CRP-like cAMP-binding protein
MPDPDRVRPLLEKNIFLGRLPGGVLDALVAKGQLDRFEKGALIYRRGDAGNGLLMVVDGRVKLTNTSLGGKEVVLYYVGVGDIFGEIPALDGKECAADAVTLEDTEVFLIPTRELLPTLTAHPPALLKVVQALCEKIRIGAEIIEDNTLEMRGRLARGLLRLARLHGERSADGKYLRLNISQEELGNYLRMSRGNVNRQLAQLRVAGLIATSGTEITILDEQGLKEAAEASPDD